MDQPFDWQYKRLWSPLYRIGYTQFVEKKGVLPRLLFIDPDPNKRMTKQPTVELYLNDAYPDNKREESMLMVWNWIGMDSKRQCEEIARVLTGSGVRARVTTDKRIYVVKFDSSKFWEEATGVMV